MRKRAEPGLLRKIVYFFPIQLLLCHFKKNIAIIIFWAILFGFVSGEFAVKYGIPYLFLDPEYLDQVNFVSFAIMGFSLGGFIMAFNLSSYIRNSFRFPFLATLSNPFIKYCVNNSVIPIAFLIYYIIKIVHFQKATEFTSYQNILIDILGLLSGMILFITVTIYYVRITNKDIYRMYNINRSRSKDLPNEEKQKFKTQRIYLKEDLNWKELTPSKEERDWHVETYLTGSLRLKLARGFEHYDKSMLKAVFRQNHKAAAIFEIIALLSMFILGLFRENSFFMIPAGGSILLLLTMLLMLTSALYTWIRGWTNIVILTVFVVLNYLFKYEQFNFFNKAFGINYSTTTSYTNKTLSDFEKDFKTLINDKNEGLTYLNNWKIKNTGYKDSKEKPKLVLINCSGGGSRSAMWVVKALQGADSALNGELMKKTALITGASGGIVGAAYFRELYLRKQLGEIDNLYSPKYVNNIGKDILNSITTTIATNDLFIRTQKFKIGTKEYIKDRGYAFEAKLNENTQNVLKNKRLIDYRQAELSATIPMLVLAPTILNDGRRLLISAQNISYLTSKNLNGRLEMEFLNEAVEFRRLFKNQDADSLLFTSAIRMAATFPYISPIVSLPSEPRMDVMDAGIRDNFGLNTTIQFLYTFKDWIAQNTSGVVILQIRDRDKNFEIEENPLNTIVQTFSSPVGSFYNNMFHMQDYNNDQLIKYCNNWFAGTVEVVNLELHNLPTDHISLSWHLTTREKRKIISSFYNNNNQKALNRLKSLISH